MHPSFLALWMLEESGIPGRQVMNIPSVVMLVMGILVLELTFIYSLEISSKYVPTPARMNANPNFKSLSWLYKTSCQTNGTNLCVLNDSSSSQ